MAGNKSKTKTAKTAKSRALLAGAGCVPTSLRDAARVAPERPVSLPGCRVVVSGTSAKGGDRECT